MRTPHQVPRLIYSGYFDFVGDPIPVLEGMNAFVDPGLYLGVPDTEQRFEQRFCTSDIRALEEEEKEGFLYLPDGVYFVTTQLLMEAPISVNFDAYCGTAFAQATAVSELDFSLTLSGAVIFGKDAEYPGLNLNVYRAPGEGDGEIKGFGITIVKLAPGPDTT